MKFLAVLILGSVPLFAQSGFEVAVIKAAAPGQRGMRIMGGPGAGGRFSANNVTVRMLLTSAYGVQDFQISGGPDWINSERFDIEARSPGVAPSTQEQYKAMLQSFLQERFQLEAHRETKEGSTYALTAGKNGLKMRLSADQTEPDYGAPAPGQRIARGVLMAFPGHLEGSALTVENLIQPLMNALRQTVVNRTGLTQRFDIDLKWSDADGPSIFTAVQEQLGLRLESIRGPVETVVVDRIQKPSEN